MERKELGKVQKVICGFGGYQDAQIGIGFILGGKSWGISTPFYGAWATERKEGYTQWTEEDRINQLGKVFMKICQWLKDCKVQEVHELQGQPVECIFDGMMLKEWRFLTEVI